MAIYLPSSRGKKLEAVIITSDEDGNRAGGVIDWETRNGGPFTT